MGRVLTVELEGRSYRCKFCRTHLALPLDLVSKAFHSPRGKAYLFNNAVNITLGAFQERMMLSERHKVADVFCCSCGEIVGWKYSPGRPHSFLPVVPFILNQEAAHERSQKYKEGKFVLERGRIVDEMDFPAGVLIDTHPGMSDTED